MINSARTICLTRTVPCRDFSVILHWVHVRYPHDRIVLLLQEGSIDQIAEADSHPCHLIPAGPFRFPGKDHPLCSALKKERAKMFVIAANNPAFAGYEQFIRLALACRAQRILLVSKDLKQKKIGAWRLNWKRFTKQAKSTMVFGADALLFLLTLPLFPLLLPFLWFKYRKQFSISKKS